MMLDIGIWLSSWFGSGANLSAMQMGLRAVAIFLLTLMLIRVSGRRSFGQRTAFDSCVTVLLGAVMSRAVVGASPFWPVMVACTVIVVMHRLLGLASIIQPRLDTIINGTPRHLIEHGAIDTEAMRRGLVTMRDLEESIRKYAGDGTIAQIQRATLERNGEITITFRQQPIQA